MPLRVYYEYCTVLVYQHGTRLMIKYVELSTFLYNTGVDPKDLADGWTQLVHPIRYAVLGPQSHIWRGPETGIL